MYYYVTHSYPVQLDRLSEELMRFISPESTKKIEILIINGIDEIHEKDDLDHLDNVIVRLFKVVEGGKKLIEAE